MKSDKHAAILALDGSNTVWVTMLQYNAIFEVSLAVRNVPFILIAALRHNNFVETK